MSGLSIVIEIKVENFSRATADAQKEETYRLMKINRLGPGQQHDIYMWRRGNSGLTNYKKYLAMKE